MKKILTFGIMLLFLLMTVSSANETYMEKQSIKPSSFGNTLYVGGNGPGNYSKIQDAIDNASDGDTVYVYDDSSPYNETLDVNNSINLIGEDKDTTVIEGVNYIVNITANDTIISGFTLKIIKSKDINYTTRIMRIITDNNFIYGNIFLGNNSDGVVAFYSNYINISNNIFSGIISNGIHLIECNYNKVYNNILISKNFTFRVETGILIERSNNNRIFCNTISGFYTGIDLFFTKNNIIYKNIITNNIAGIESFFNNINDTIYRNNILNNDYGFLGLNIFNYKIIENNFIGNRINADFFYQLYIALWAGVRFSRKIPPFHNAINWDSNYWDDFYWDDIKYKSYRIKGFVTVVNLNQILRIEIAYRLGINYEEFIKNWIHLDRNPASEPYDIEV